GLLAQTLQGIEHSASPDNHTFSLWSKASERSVALDDGDAQLPLQLADSGRERWLGDMAALCRASEVSMLIELDEIPELAHEHCRVLCEECIRLSAMRRPSGRVRCGNARGLRRLLSLARSST